MNTSAAWLASELRARTHRRTRLRGDRGEGVISAAIAVLIMAFLGAALWVGFSLMSKSLLDKTCTEAGKVGAAAGAQGQKAC